MWDTVLDHIEGYKQGLASTTYLVYMIEGMHKPGILKNEPSHAEEKFINLLWKNHKGPLKITIYINNSPCAECAKLLKEFVENNQNIQMVFYITHLYNIKRSSCILRKKTGKDERHIKYIRKANHEDNYRGLRNLMSLGGNRCRFEAFTEKVWKDLLVLSGISKELAKLQMGNYNRRKKGYDRSRQNEDRRIKKDLNWIKTHIDP